MDYIFDYHIHSCHSTDGYDKITDICRAAIKKGLKEIAITDHFEPSSKDPEYQKYKPYAYWMDIILAREYFKGQLNIKMGVELGQPHLFMKSSASLIEQVPYDYVIGSAHKFPSGLDCSELNYRELSIEDVCQMYLHQLRELAWTADFDCIGHLDLIKRYCTKIYGKRITLEIEIELLTEVLKILIARGKGIEINASGLRQDPRETMPGVDVLKIYKSLGGEVLTLGSDAHFAKDVGEGIRLAAENAKEAGFEYLTVYEGRKPEWVPIGKGRSRVFIGNRDAV